MREYVIISDAACELDEEFQKRFNIIVMDTHIQTPQCEDMKAGVNWDKVDRDDFFRELSANPNGYKTSPASIDEVKEEFKKHLAEGKDILSVSLSSGISGAYSFVLRAREELLEEFPDAKINCVDSLRFGAGIGLLAIEASKLRDQGKDIDEVTKYLEENKNRLHQTGWLDDLQFVAKKGRLTNAKAFFGTLAGVKPIGEFDYNGLTTVIAKVKGAKSAYKVFMEYLEAELENPEEQMIIIVQSQREKQAEVYKEMIEERFHPAEVKIVELHMINGANVGPGLMAAYYFGKPISKDLEEERELLNNIIKNLKK